MVPGEIQEFSGAVRSMRLPTPSILAAEPEVTDN